MQPIILQHTGYIRELDAWHLRLAILSDVLNLAVTDCFSSSTPSAYEDLFFILMEDFRRQVESCPFPPALGVSDEQ